jgi:hypothetical protein
MSEKKFVEHEALTLTQQIIAPYAAEIERLRAALENISDNGGDTLTIEDAVRIADAALAVMEPPDA